MQYGLFEYVRNTTSYHSKVKMEIHLMRVGNLECVLIEHSIPWSDLVNQLDVLYDVLLTLPEKRYMIDRLFHYRGAAVT